MDKYIKVGVGAIIIDNGKILLSQRQGSHGAGTWGSVGGHVEFGETPTQAIKREAMEEMGIELGNLQFISCFNMFFEEKHYIDVGFKSEIISGIPKIQPDEVGKFVEVKWFDLDDLPSPLFPPIEKYLEAIRSGKGYYE